MESRPQHYKWREISDLPGDLYSLRDRELESLYQIWTEEKQRIGNDKGPCDFNG